MALLLQAYGLDVGHETMGARGISSFALAVTAEDGAWGPTRQRYRFARVIHLVREPVATIASFAAMSEKPFAYFRRFIYLPADLATLERSAMAWIGWNRLVATQDPDARIRVEDAAAVLPGLLRRWKLSDGSLRGALPAGDTNARPHAALCWDDLRSALTPPLFRELERAAVDFGYGPPAA